MHHTKTHLLYVKWIHCKACAFVIEETIKAIEGVSSVSVSLTKQTVEIITTSEKLASNIALLWIINPLLKEHGYSVYSSAPKKQISWWECFLASIMAFALIYGFVQLQQVWLLQLLHTEHRSYGTSFLIGLIASVSSCLAVVWWVVLALWTVYTDKSFRPQMLFHIWRLAWFFMLWWMLWWVWSIFTISPTASTVLNMIIAVVLFMLWLNLLWVINWWIAFKGTIFKRFMATKASILWPLVLWIWTFFLPCWFTQSMQIYTLSTGSFWVWGITMLSFTLWTLPVLLLLSITWKTIQQSDTASLFFKTIGIILIVSSLYNFANSLVVLWVISPFFSF